MKAKKLLMVLAVALGALSLAVVILTVGIILARDNTTLMTLKHDVIVMGFGPSNIKTDKMGTMTHKNPENKDMAPVIRCSDNSPVKFINTQWVCDGHNDCGDWYDEQRCHTCGVKHKELYKCEGSGRCILSAMLCDGFNQCGDWEDEQCSCTSPQFLCFLQCVSDTETCRDKGQLCGSNINTWSEELDQCDCKKCITGS